MGRLDAVLVEPGALAVGAVLAADAPLYGRAREAFAVRPLKPGYLADPFPGADPEHLPGFHAL